MKEYDLICIGTGSGMSIVQAMINENPKLRVAVIDKDEPGGICLTKGCIPSKILLYPAELVRTIQKAPEFGIKVDLKSVNFKTVMDRMRNLINKDINMIRQGLSHSPNIDYFHASAEFVSPYVLKVDEKKIKAKMIILCTGSKPAIPPIKGINNVSFQTSDSVLEMDQLPPSIGIVGGGYIAAEFGHFFSAMGSKVTVIGRNPRFLPQEEPEVSALAKRKLKEHLTLLTNHEVLELSNASSGKKRIIARNRTTGDRIEVDADEIVIAVGRSPNTDILNPEKGGIATDERGWIKVDEHLETSKPNVWALGDANGKYQFKHVANYEAMVVYYNAVLKTPLKVNYFPVPHAVFTYPEVASVGLKESEATAKYGEDNIFIGFQKYEDTAKGEAMGVKEYFVKVILEKESNKILGAHIIGPYASVLIQEIINLMYTPEKSAEPMIESMHIHPALNEVVQRAFTSLMTTEQYHHFLKHNYEFDIG